VTQAMFPLSPPYMRPHGPNVHRTSGMVRPVRRQLFFVTSSSPLRPSGRTVASWLPAAAMRAVQPSSRRMSHFTVGPVFSATMTRQRPYPQLPLQELFHACCTGL